MINTPRNCFITVLINMRPLEKTEGEFKNGQSRDTGNNVFKTQDEDKQNKTHKTKKMRSTRPYNNPRVNVLTKRK